jgi:hypothetical protein
MSIVSSWVQLDISLGRAEILLLERFSSENINSDQVTLSSVAKLLNKQRWLFIKLWTKTWCLPKSDWLTADGEILSPEHRGSWQFIF